MAKVGKNIITQGLSGMLGDQLVFRIRGGKTIVSKAPVKTDTPLSESQKHHKRRFQEAVLYAKSVIAIPESKEAYQSEAKDGQSAYNVAVADFLNAPQIDEIDVSQYTGQSGSVILVRAVDDFDVAEVSVEITNADGELVEEGQAIEEMGGLQWKYTATTANGDISGDKITIRVSDVPGNLSEESLDI